MKVSRVAGLALALSLIVGAAEASPITSLPSGTVVPIPAYDYFGSGPCPDPTFCAAPFPGVSWSSTSPYSVLGYTYGGPCERRRVPRVSREQCHHQELQAD